MEFMSAIKVNYYYICYFMPYGSTFSMTFLIKAYFEQLADDKPISTWSKMVKLGWFSYYKNLMNIPDD